MYNPQQPLRPQVHHVLFKRCELVPYFQDYLTRVLLLDPTPDQQRLYGTLRAMSDFNHRMICQYQGLMACDDRTLTQLVLNAPDRDSFFLLPHQQVSDMYTQVTELTKQQNKTKVDHQMQIETDIRKLIIAKNETVHRSHTTNARIDDCVRKLEGIQKTLAVVVKELDVLKGRMDAQVSPTPPPTPPPPPPPKSEPVKRRVETRSATKRKQAAAGD